MPKIFFLKHANVVNSALGIVVNNPSVAQLVITEEGVRSHTANVLSGGTAINMAILIHENDEYFEYLEREAGVKFNRTLLYQVTLQIDTNSFQC